VRDVYLADTPADAATLLDKAIIGCTPQDDVAEIRSLGNTLASWRHEILAHHDTGASNGPTEGLNLCVKKIKRLSTASDRSRTTGCACCSTPVASPGRTTHTTTHQNPLSPLRRVEPLLCSLNGGAEHRA
jgi:transposase